MFMVNLKIPKITLISQAVILGVSASLLVGIQANATEMIELKYQERSATVSTSDLNRFARNGVVPQSIQDLFNTTDQVPDFLSSLLNQELKISPNFINSFLDSSIGNFVLGGLDEVINESSSKRDLTNIKSTVTAAYNDDNRVSLLEILERYPQRRIKVNVTSLEGTYNKVSGIVEDVLPALEVAKSYVQDIVCDCQPVAKVSEDGTTTLVANNTANCNQTAKVATESVKTQEERIAEIIARNSTKLSQLSQAK